MSVKMLRINTGLTQREFAQKYQIPLQTLKQWEASPKGTSFRTPPRYVVHMLERLTAIDFGGKEGTSNSRVDDLLKAAVLSKHDAKLWLRYLRKEFNGERCMLQIEDIQQLLKQEELTMYQKISLKRAAECGSATNRYIAALNLPVQPTMIDEIIRRQADV